MYGYVRGIAQAIGEQYLKTVFKRERVMQDEVVYCRSAQLKIVKRALAVILGSAIITRIYFYLWHKDLWRDESALFLAIYQGTWRDIFQCTLDFNQCCPLVFALVNKLLMYFSCSEYTLYFLPGCAGIGLLVMLVLLAKKMEGNLYALLCLSIICMLKMPIYYSSEFKQYIFEAFISTSLIYIYIYDIISERTENFLSYRYPLLMSGALLISNTSIFISAGISTTIAIYLKYEKDYNLYNIIRLFATRYSLFCIVCFLYYFFYLKNGNNTAMKIYWEPYFFPTSLSAWPHYLQEVLIPLIRGLFESVHLSLAKFIIFAAPFGIYFLWRKNRFVTLALILPFFFAGIAAFSFYPPGHEGFIGARLSLYLLPLCILLIGQGFLPPVRWAVTRISTRALQYLACLLVAAVLCIQILFVLTGMGHEQIHSLITTLKQSYTENDALMVFESATPAWRYYTIVDRIDLPYTILPRDILQKTDEEKSEIFREAFLHGKEHLYILYSHCPVPIMEKLEHFLTQFGYRVAVTSARGARLYSVIPPK